MTDETSSCKAAVRAALKLWVGNNRQAAFEELLKAVQLSNADRTGQIERQTVSALTSALTNKPIDAAGLGKLEAVASLLPQFVVRCSLYARRIIDVLFEKLHNWKHKRQVLKVCLDKLLESFPERAIDVFAIMHQRLRQNIIEYKAGKLIIDNFVEQFPEAATDVFVQFFDALDPNLGEGDARQPWRAENAAVEYLGRLLRLNPLRAEDIFRALCSAYLHRKLKQSVVLQLRTALEVCSDKTEIIVAMIRESCLSLAVKSKRAAIQRLPDAIRACPDQGMQLTDLLFQKYRGGTGCMRATALQELPRAAKFYPSRAKEFVGTFYRAYVRGDSLKRERIADGVPYALDAGLKEDQEEKLVDLLLHDCRNNDMDLRTAATRQLVSCMVAHPTEKEHFFEALLKSCHDRRLKVRRVAVEQLSDAAGAFPCRAACCAEAAFRMRGDGSPNVRKRAGDQLDTVLKSFPDVAIDMLRTLMQDDEESRVDTLSKRPPVSSEVASEESTRRKFVKRR